MHMWYYYVVKKLVVGTQCIYRRSGSNYSLQLQKAQTAVLTSTSYDTLLVAVTQRMTELAARVYTATPCTLLVHYTECVTEQVDFPLFICGYTIDTTLTQLP